MWGRIGLYAGCASLAVLAGCSSMSERVQKLETESAEMRQELAMLKSEDMISLADLFDVYWDSNYGRINASLCNRYLTTIKLPENPSANDVDAYLSKLYGIRRLNQDSAQENLLAGKIALIGPEYVENLVPYLEYGPFSKAFAQLGGGEQKDLLKRAIILSQNNSRLIQLFVGIADESDADYIIATLPQMPELVDAVTKLQMTEKVLPIMKQKLLDSAENRFNYESRWLTASLNAMKEEERSEFITAYWGKLLRSGRVRGNEWEMRERSEILAGFGSIAAFQFMVDAGLGKDGNQNNYLQRAMGFSPYSALDEFIIWYKENRDQLTFDSKQTIFVSAVKDTPAEK